MPDNVNHPSHYQSDEGIEVIDVIAAFTKKLSGVDAFDIGCAIKYILRFTEKNGIEDLEKAKWYIDDYIKRHSQEDIINGETSPEFYLNLCNKAREAILKIKEEPTENE